MPEVLDRNTVEEQIVSYGSNMRFVFLLLKWKSERRCKPIRGLITRKREPEGEVIIYYVEYQCVYEYRILFMKYDAHNYGIRFFSSWKIQVPTEHKNAVFTRTTVVLYKLFASSVEE